jgi:non-specific serine/threonine protein kinase
MIERALRPAREALGPAAAESAWAEGAAMTVEEAVRYALTEEPEGEPLSMPAPSGGATDGTRAHPDTQERRASGAAPLSPREAEVAILVARGLTNPQIASALIISERTAARHVEHILAKLGFATRAQIAVWAAEHRLLVHDEA